MTIIPRSKLLVWSSVFQGDEIIRKFVFERLAAGGKTYFNRRVLTEKAIGILDLLQIALHAQGARQRIIYAYAADINKGFCANTGNVHSAHFRKLAACYQKKALLPDRI